MLWLLIIGMSILLLGGVAIAWRTWRVTMQRNSRADAYDNRMALLNDRQANRLSDEQLTQNVSDDDAWRVMVRRGLQPPGRPTRPPRRSTRRPR